MTEWDLISQLLKSLDAPGFSDAFLRFFLIILVILILWQCLPLPGKPISWIFKQLGKAMNADVLSRVENVETRLHKQEKDSVRTQMLILISDYPENSQEILEVARHYFQDLHGDWYMTEMFSTWLVKYGHGQAEWFLARKKEEGKDG